MDTYLTSRDAARIVGESPRTTQQRWKQRGWTNLGGKSKLLFNADEIERWHTCQKGVNRKTKQVRYVPWGFRGASAAVAMTFANFVQTYNVKYVPYYVIPQRGSFRLWTRRFNPAELEEWANQHGHPFSLQAGDLTEYGREWDEQGSPPTYIGRERNAPLEGTEMPEREAPSAPVGQPLDPLS